MKRLPLSLALIVLIFIMLLSLSCTKTETNNVSQFDDIFGKWEIEKSVGGLAGTITYPAGNGDIYEFKSDGVFNRYLNAALLGTGTYTVWYSGSQGKIQLHIYTPTYEQQSAIEIDKANDQLIFLPRECCDVPSVYYKKIP